MEFLLFVMKVFLVITVAVKAEEEESCTVHSKFVYNLHGEYYEGGINTHVTVCLAELITANSPISFNEYTDYLKISRNGSVPKVYNNSFALMPNLKTLIMAEKQVDELESGAFNGLSNLNYLDLGSNNLRNLPQNVFDDVPNLVVLQLSSNKLTKIDRHLFDKLENLKTLRLDNNKITELENQWYAGLGSLRYLSLASNQLSKVKTMEYFGLRNLDTLLIQNNSITIVERDGFKGLEHLKYLDMHTYENSLVLIVQFDLKHELENMPKLESLSLSHGAFECGVIPLAQEYLKYVNKTVIFWNRSKSSSCWEYGK